MDWQDAVKKIAPLAPAVAAALGGPMAGGVTAGAVKMVSSILGVEETPDAVVAALDDPKKREALAKLNNEHERELIQMRLDAEKIQAAEETKRLQAVNETMRVEAKAEGWFKSGWRPFNGWSLGVSLTATNLALLAIVVRDPSYLAEVLDVLIWSVAAQGAIQGINIKKRSDDKALRVGKEPRSFMDRVVGRK